MNYTISLRLSLSVEGDTLFYIQFDNSSIETSHQNLCSNHVSVEAVTIEILEYSIKIRAQSYYQQQI